MSSRVEIAGCGFILDPSGAAFRADSGLLVVSDLHLETGSAFARRGTLLPPYDTMATLHRLERLLDRFKPATVVSLGDGFHDRHGHQSLPAAERDLLQRLCGAVRWIWISGNHDPLPPAGLVGEACHDWSDGGIIFRHIPAPVAGGEIAGHLHPKALVQGSRLRVRRRCFLTDGRRLVMPAFGSYTGGLNALDADVRVLFPAGYDAHLLGKDRMFRLPHHQLIEEPPSARMDLLRQVRFG